MDKLLAMRVFVRVAELASFTQAADELGLPKASISNAVQQLESQLDTRLLQRTTRRVRMTQDGNTYYQRCKDLLGDLDELESLFQHTAAHITGRLRVDLPTGLAEQLILPNLPRFLDQHPGIELELGSSDRRVDLVQEGFDCVVRVGNLGDSDLIARPLGQMHIINCVSPGYVEFYGQPYSIDDLSQHRLIHYVPHLGADSGGWEYWDGAAFRNLTIPGPLTVNNARAYLAACLAGLGIIQVPEVAVREYVRDGTLVEILANYRAEPMPVSLIYPHRRNLSKRVQVFMDWLTGLIKNYLA